MIMDMTQYAPDEFIERKCKEYGVTREQFDKVFYVDLCPCKTRHCEGWIVLPKIRKEGGNDNG